MNYPKHILICGLGSIGRYYVRLIRKKWPFIKISILRSGKGKDFKEIDLADQIFFNFSDALDSKPNACIISSPAPFHLEHALFFAKAGIPLLIEKPVGTLEESPGPYSWDELIEINKNIPIFVGYIFRSDPCSKYLEKIISSNQLGKLIEADFFCGSWLPEWRQGIEYQESVSASKALGGGVLLELSHEIDIAQWLLGEITLHSALLNNKGVLGIDVEESALLTGFNDNCHSISFRLNFCSKPSRRLTTIRGTLGEAIWDVSNKIITYNGGKGDSKVKHFRRNKDDLFSLQLLEFFNSLNSHNSFLCNLSEGLSVLRLIKRAKQLESEIL